MELNLVLMKTFLKNTYTRSSLKERKLLFLQTLNRRPSLLRGMRRPFTKSLVGIYNVIGGCTLYIQREVGVDVVYTTYILNITNGYLMRYTFYDITVLHYNA